MHAIRHLSVIAILTLACAWPAAAQNKPPTQSQQPAQPQLAPARPYKPIVFTLAKPVSDAAFEAMRKQLGEAAEKKDRAALSGLVVAQGFFWERENGDGADKQKAGIDNLSAALGLAKNNGAGWDMLASYAEDPTASPAPEHKGAMCAPADPVFDEKAFDALLEATRTDPDEWGYPVSAGIDVHAKADANAPSVGKLGTAFVRVMPENTQANPAYLRVVMPDGKTGYVSVDSIAPLGSDRLCYVKEGGAWKIGGYVGGGEPQ
jgi:hypothetical protein